MSDVPRETPPTPDEAWGVFRDRLPLAERYADLLAEEATVRGLIGPREVPRLWERHLLNCALLTDLIPPVAPGAATVCDVGSGAGLPGLVVAVRRPDLRVTLLEPLLRRTRFLDLAVERLELDNVEVVRGRAEEFHVKPGFDVVVSRAVAPLDRLAGWCLPLTRRGGRVLAMKGSSAAEEVQRARSAVRRAGGGEPEVLEVRDDDPRVDPATIVAIQRVAAEDGRRTTKGARR